MSKAFFQIRAGDLAMRRGMATGGGGEGVQSSSNILNTISYAIEQCVAAVTCHHIPLGMAAACKSHPQPTLNPPSTHSNREFSMRRLNERHRRINDRMRAWACKICSIDGVTGP